MDKIPAPSEFEKATVDMLLRGDHPVLAELRLQFSQAKDFFRSSNSAGFWIHFSLPDDCVPINEKFPIKSRFLIDDVIAVADGVELNFILWIDEGHVGALEGYPVDGQPCPQAITEYELEYRSSPRDLQRIEKNWAA